MKLPKLTPKTTRAVIAEAVQTMKKRQQNTSYAYITAWFDQNYPEHLHFMNVFLNPAEAIDEAGNVFSITAGAVVFNIYNYGQGWHIDLDSTLGTILIPINCEED